MEAQQCVKLTGTNRSIGLTCSHRQGACAKRKSARSEDRKQTTDKTIGHLSSSQFCFSSDEKRPTMEDRRYPFSVVRRPFFAGLVALSEAFKTRSHPELGRQKPQAPMVLCLKTWESRSSPGPPRTDRPTNTPLPLQHREWPIAKWRTDLSPFATPFATRSRRGVEQPGSSSGS